MTQSNPGLKKQFEDEGYIILKGAISEQEMAPLRSLTDKIVSVAEDNPDDLFCNYYMGHRADQGALYDLFQRFPPFARLTRNQTLINAIRAVYSDNFYMYENCLVYKPKGKANAIPWHQDFISRTTEPIKVIAWMALDDVDEENGCMYAVPQSHKLGFLPYRYVPGETAHDQLDLSKVDMDEDKIVPLKMKAGDILLFNQLVLHMSKEIHSDRPRRAYRVSYQDFKQSYTPRGTPIVMHLEDMSLLEKPYEIPESEKPKPVIQRNLLQRGLHKIGRKLLTA